MKISDLLSPFGTLYGAAIKARQQLYAKGVFKTYDLGAPTVSVGNLTVGGTGKTPLVAFVAKVLAERGEWVCVLSRGYKRADEGEMVLVSDGEKILADARSSGDEPAELARKLLGISAVIADANRARAGNWARANLRASAFVLDDAFQHLKVRRDLDIVCVDATNPFGNRKLFPAGILREPLQSLKRAGAFVITRANLVDESRVADLKARISQYNQKAKIFVSQNKTAGLTFLGEFNAGAQKRRDAAEGIAGVANYESQESKDKGQRIKNKFLAFCALGNPESFFEQLRRENFNLISTETFSDHHFYTQRNVDELEKRARTKGAEILLTTAKDAVKLKDLKFDLPCLVVESELVFDDEDGLRELIGGAGLVPAQ